MLGAGTRKRKPRYTREEVNLWEDQTKGDNYWAGRKQRKELKGLTRAGRLAYFRALRAKCSDADREAWKQSWKTRTAKWNKKRQPVPKKGGVEGEKEHERRHVETTSS